MQINLPPTFRNHQTITLLSWYLQRSESCMEGSMTSTSMRSLLPVDLVKKLIMIRRHQTAAEGKRRAARWLAACLLLVSPLRGHAAPSQPCEHHPPVEKAVGESSHHDHDGADRQVIKSRLAVAHVGLLPRVLYGRSKTFTNVRELDNPALA